jgi:hypothetical protein
VISCLCTPEPLDENDEPADLRFSECPIETLIPGRRTPELARSKAPLSRTDLLPATSLSLPKFYDLCAGTACSAAARLLTFLVNNRCDLIDCQRARMAGRRVSSASAESVMTHLINRRLTKRQQMRWSMKGAHYLLQTRVELLDGRLETCFATRFPQHAADRTK